MGNELMVKNTATKKEGSNVMRLKKKFKLNKKVERKTIKCAEAITRLLWKLQKETGHSVVKLGIGVQPVKQEDGTMQYARTVTISMHDPKSITDEQLKEIQEKKLPVSEALEKLEDKE